MNGFIRLIKEACTFNGLNCVRISRVSTRKIALGNASKEKSAGAVYFYRVAGEIGGWAEFVVTQDKKPHLLYEAQISDDSLRALGVTV